MEYLPAMAIAIFRFLQRVTGQYYPSAKKTIACNGLLASNRHCYCQVIAVDYLPVMAIAIVKFLHRITGQRYPLPEKNTCNGLLASNCHCNCFSCTELLGSNSLYGKISNLAIAMDYWPAIATGYHRQLNNINTIQFKTDSNSESLTADCLFFSHRKIYILRKLKL